MQHVTLQKMCKIPTLGPLWAKATTDPARTLAASDQQSKGIREASYRSDTDFRNSIAGADRPLGTCLSGERCVMHTECIRMRCAVCGAIG